jgi:hypothetical protein
LIQVGVLKSLSLLKDGKFDKTKSSLKNYLYTGVRNEMKNYLYKNFKEVSVDDSILCSMNESSERLDAVEDSLLIISKKECLEVLSRFETRNVGVSDKVFSSLEWLGFTIEGVVSEKRYYPDVEMLVTLLIWKHMEKYYEYKK